MPEVSVPWGHQELTLILPEHWTLQQVAQSSLPPAPEDWRERLAVALSQPSTGEPLTKLLRASRHGRIVLLVEDIARGSPLADILTVLMKEIRHAGVKREQIEIVFATGMHPPLTPRQAAEKLGPPGEGIRWRCNPWDDKSEYVCVGQVGNLDIWIDRGVATADLRILISGVSPHLQAGFGGGYKMVLPGCAHLETIRALHRLGVDRRPRQLVGTDASCNPMRMVVDAGGKLLEDGFGKSFAVQYVLDENNLCTFIAAGEVIPSQGMLAKRCSVSCGVVTPQPADILITNAHPLDFDLWQSFKCIANTRWAVRANGVIISLSRCEGGLNGVNPPPWPLPPAWTRRLVRLFGAEAVYSLLTRAIPRLAGDAAFFLRLALHTIQRNPVFMVSPALHARGERFPGMELFPTSEQAIAHADRLLGGNPQRVIVFPHGGTTFPVLTSGVPSPAAPPQETYANSK